MENNQQLHTDNKVLIRVISFCVALIVTVVTSISGVIYMKIDEGVKEQATSNINVAVLAEKVVSIDKKVDRIDDKVMSLDKGFATVQIRLGHLEGVR